MLDLQQEGRIRQPHVYLVKYLGAYLGEEIGYTRWTCPLGGVLFSTRTPHLCSYVEQGYISISMHNGGIIH